MREFSSSVTGKDPVTNAGTKCRCPPSFDQRQRQNKTSSYERDAEMFRRKNYREIYVKRQSGALCRQARYGKINESERNRAKPEPSLRQKKGVRAVR